MDDRQKAYDRSLEGFPPHGRDAAMAREYSGATAGGAMDAGTCERMTPQQVLCTRACELERQALGLRALADSLPKAGVLNPHSERLIYEILSKLTGR